MTADAYIRAVFHDMKQRNSIKRTTNPEYTIRIEKNNFIKIYGHFDHPFNTQVTQLSDIHAILQLCHPNEPYYIHYDIELSENCAHITVYSYSDAPNIITGRNPNNKYNTYYIIDLHSLNIHITPNESFNNVIQRTINTIHEILPCTRQYPHITLHYTQLQIYVSFPSNDDMLIHIIVIRTSPTEAEIKISICHKAAWLQLSVFHIPLDHTDNIYAQYHACIAHRMPALIEDIHAYISSSQHEKIHIIRALHPYLTAQTRYY